MVRKDFARRHRAVDMVLLASVIGLSIATWATISHLNGVIAWKHCFGISVAIFLALAAITPHKVWAISVRLATSGWLVGAPWMLAFEDMRATRWAYVIAGSLIGAMSALEFFTVLFGRSKKLHFPEVLKEETITPVPRGFAQR